MRVRFVTTNEFSSALIRLREGECVPFTPSHVEIDIGTGLLGAYENAVANVPAGIYIRPYGYDASYLKQDDFVEVFLPEEDAALTWAKSMIGTPYDWAAVLDYVVDRDLHEEGHLICSAFVIMVLVRGKFFKASLAVPAHACDPRDVRLLISAQVAYGQPAQEAVSLPDIQLR